METGNKITPSVGVAVITHRAKKHLRYCLPPLLQSPLKPAVLVVNSSSNDGTVALAEQLEAKTLIIPRSEFNHGLTREKARKFLSTDIVVMLTPDAYPTDSSLLGKLVAPLIDGRASVSYARQLPHEGADIFESFLREFNYPEASHIRSLADFDKYGIYTFFCSNSCAAYLNSALDEIGGFPEVLIGEDTYAAARLLHRGHKIAYVAEAYVRHSHSYNLYREFCRHFDTGLARKQYQALLNEKESDKKRGRLFAKSLLKHVAKEKPFLLPYAVLHLASKWFGYCIGRLSVNAPKRFKKMLSLQDFYWKFTAKGKQGFSK